MGQISGAEENWICMGHKQTLFVRIASKEMEMVSVKECHKGLHVSKPVAQSSCQVEKPALAAVQWML